MMEWLEFHTRKGRKDREILAAALPTAEGSYVLFRCKTRFYVEIMEYSSACFRVAVFEHTLSTTAESAWASFIEIAGIGTRMTMDENVWKLVESHETPL